MQEPARPALTPFRQPEISPAMQAMAGRRESQMSHEAAVVSPRWTPVLATRDDLPKILALYEQVWGPGRSLDYLGWKLFDAPFEPLPPMLAMDGDACVGLYAVVATPMILDGQPIMGCQSVDTMTHPDYRRQNMSVTLARACYAEAERRGFRLVYGMPNENSYPMFMKHLDWVKTDDMLRWVRPLAARRLPAFLAEPANRIIRAHALRGDIRSAIVSRVTADTRFVVPRAMPVAARCHVDKSAAWLQWRYAAEPGAAYQTYLTGDPDFPDALIVFEEIRETGVPPVLLVQEWLARDTHLRLKAMKGLVALAARRGCGSVVLYTNDPQAGILLRGALFLPRPGMPIGATGFGPDKAKTPLKQGQIVLMGGDKD